MPVAVQMGVSNKSSPVAWWDATATSQSPIFEAHAAQDGELLQQATAVRKCGGGTARMGIRNSSSSSGGVCSGVCNSSRASNAACPTAAAAAVAAAAAARAARISSSLYRSSSSSSRRRSRGSSGHINLGITDPEWLFAAVRLVRCEAALLLALSASSPFLDGRFTGHHSQRWQQFPLTPSEE